ncbi:MAG: NblA/ycf18 family protein [Cyanobacteria bacterium J06631_2]
MPIDRGDRPSKDCGNYYTLYGQEICNFYYNREKQAEANKMDKLRSSLSVEQEFSLRVFSDRIKQLSRAETQKLLTQMHYQMMLKENLYQELFLNQEQDIASVLFGVEQ